MLLAWVMKCICCLSVITHEALRDLREVHADLFQGVLSVKEFMWQHNMSGVCGQMPETK